MSENEMIIQQLDRIEKMLLPQTLQKKEVLKTKEAASYMGRSVSSLYRLRRNGTLQSNRPNNGGLYFERIDCYNWMLSRNLIMISEKVTEEEKMTILIPERN